MPSPPPPLPLDITALRILELLRLTDPHPAGRAPPEERTAGGYDDRKGFPENAFLREGTGCYGNDSGGGEEVSEKLIGELEERVSKAEVCLCLFWLVCSVFFLFCFLFVCLRICLCIIFFVCLSV